MERKQIRAGLLWAATSWVAACGSPSVFGGSYGDASNGGFSSRDASASTPDVQPPPETEDTRTFLQPRAGGRFLYVLNPLRDSVAVIDSSTLAIETVEVGRRPEYVLTESGRDVALVINTGSTTISILRTENGRTTVSHVQGFAGANAIAFAPDGNHALVYQDTSDTASGLQSGSFQDVMVVTLTPGAEQAVRLTVGFRPVSVLFSGDGSSAFVVTEDGISILRFAQITGPTLIPNVSLADHRVEQTPWGSDAGEAGTVEAGLDGGVFEAHDAPVDVSVTPDGRYAIARTEGSATVRLVDLENRTIQRLDAGGPVTDLDLTPDGRQAVAVVRSLSRVVRIAVPQGFSDPSLVQGTELRSEFFGSVTLAPDGRSALLYTTAADEHRLLRMDLAGNAGTVAIPLRKTVQSVTFAPDGRTAIVVHRTAPGNPAQPGLDLQQQIDRTPGYSILDPVGPFAKLQLSPTAPGPMALVPDGTFAFVLFRDDSHNVAAFDRIDLRSFVVTSSSVGSPPLSVGAVPSTGKVFIGQQHAEGRVSFVDWQTGRIQSLTGFELNARIVN